MPTLDAVLAPGASGLAELRLTYRMNPSDRDPKQIYLKQLRRLNDASSQRIPAYFVFDDGGPVADESLSYTLRTRPPSITIIAAPGVSVELRNFPSEAYTASDAIPRLEIIRVQNPRMVPTIGAPSSSAALLSEYFVDTNPGPLTFSGAPADTEDEDDGDGDGDADSDSEAPDPSDGIFDSRAATARELENYLYGLVPSLGRQLIVRAEFDPMRLLEGESPLTYTSEHQSSPSYLHISRMYNGVIFTHPYSSQALYVVIPAFCRTLSSSEREDHEARFAYRINPPAANPGGRTMPLVTLIKTPNVSVTLTSMQSGSIVDADPLRERYDRSLVFFEVFDAPFERIPSQGGAFSTRGLRRPVMHFQPDPILAVYAALFDLTVGLIPVVGDLADIAELIYAVGTDRDRWGRQVSTLDKVLMGVGAVLPIAGTAALRSAPRLLAAFGRHSDAVRRIESSIERAGFTADERSILLEAHEELRRGRRLRPARALEVSQLLRRLPPCLA